MKSLHSTTSRIISILELVANTKEGYTLTEISRNLKIPKTSLSPILKTLAYHNYLLYNEISLKYSLYIGILNVSSSINKNNAIVKFIKEEMNKVVKECNEICQLGVLNNTEVLYVEKVNSSNAIQLVSSVGVKLPANCSALGKALLFKYSLEDLKSLFSKGLEKRTENTITSIEKLYEEIIKIEENGYATEKEEGMKEVECIAIPIIKDNKVLAAVSVSIPIFRSTQKKKDKIINILTSAKKRVENYISNMNVKSIFD